MREREGEGEGEGEIKAGNITSVGKYSRGWKLHRRRER